MASEWIPMSRNLNQNPKAIGVAEFLMEQDEFIEWVRVTFCVTKVTLKLSRCVTFQALHAVWSAVNTCITDGDEARGMTLRRLNTIAEVPCFAEAMLSVGWIEEGAENTLIFPNFQENNRPEKTRKRAKTNAERQAEYRKRNEKVTKSRYENVTPLRNGVTESNAHIQNSTEQNNTEHIPLKSPGVTLVTEFGHIDRDFPDWDAVQENIIAFWNKLSGVTRARPVALGNKTLRALQERLLADNGWDVDFVQATDKFPLKCGNRWKSLNSMILDDELIPKILSGNFDKEITHAADSRIKVASNSKLDDVPITKL